MRNRSITDAPPRHGFASRILLGSVIVVIVVLSSLSTFGETRPPVEPWAGGHSSSLREYLNTEAPASFAFELTFRSRMTATIRVVAPHGQWSVSILRLGKTDAARGAMQSLGPRPA
ncbi:MAG: hypothetical protein WC538_18810 [Thermoanaerobaculia bacterium]|jgi:hypothetical protein